MNKKLFKLLLLALPVVACTTEEGEEVIARAPYTLSVDKTTIESTGKDIATFTLVDADGQVLTDNASLMSKIYFINEQTGRRLPKKTKIFKSVEDGDYVFSATFRGEASANKVTIKSENRTAYEVFKKSVCLYRLTATWCENCPSMTTGLNNVSDWTKSRLVELDFHGAGSAYAYSDGSKYVADYLYPKFKLGGYPSAIYDLAVPSDARDYTKIEDMIFERISDSPATCGIKAEVAYSNGKISVKASVKTSTGGKYDIAYALLKNNCPGGAVPYFYESEYHNVVKGVSGNYEFMSTAAKQIAKDQEQEILDLTFDYPIPESDNLSDYSVAFYALKEVGNKIEIDNAVRLALGTSVDYVYNN